MKCQNQLCQKEAPAGKKYCSRECAPLGHMSGDQRVSQKKSGQKSGEQNTDTQNAVAQHKQEQGSDTEKRSAAESSLSPPQCGGLVVKELEPIRSTDSQKHSVSLSEEGSRTINTLDLCSKRLDLLMGRLMPSGENARIDPPLANAMCNCAKHITKIARLKLDIAKEMNV